jgi:hypothetical protein
MRKTPYSVITVLMTKPVYLTLRLLTNYQQIAYFTTEAVNFRDLLGLSRVQKSDNLESF